MNQRDFNKMMSPVARHVTNMLARGTVLLSNATKKMQGLQAQLLSEETTDELEHFEPYGLTSRPKKGAEVLVGFFDGDRSHGIVIIAADRRYRLTGLQDGEVALHDDQGQFVHIKRDSVHIKANAEIVLEAPLVRATADIQATGEMKDQGGAKSMSGMRAVFDTHTHGENDGGSNTDTPNIPM